MDAAAWNTYNDSTTMAYLVSRGWKGIIFSEYARGMYRFYFLFFFFFCFAISYWKIRCQRRKHCRGEIIRLSAPCTDVNLRIMRILLDLKPRRIHPGTQWLRQNDQGYRIPCTVEEETNWKSFAEYALTRLKSITIYQHQGCQKLWIHQLLGRRGAAEVFPTSRHLSTEELF